MAKKNTKYLIENKAAYAKLELDMQYLADDARNPDSITKLGCIRMQAPVNARTAELLAEVFSCGKQGKLIPVEQMLLDILDALDIDALPIDGMEGMPRGMFTRLSSEQREKLYNWYKNVRKNG